MRSYQSQCAACATFRKNVPRTKNQPARCHSAQQSQAPERTAAYPWLRSNEVFSATVTRAFAA
jgi:hypothetical protein